MSATPRSTATSARPQDFAKFLGEEGLNEEVEA